MKPYSNDHFFGYIVDMFLVIAFSCLLGLGIYHIVKKSEHRNNQIEKVK